MQYRVADEVRKIAQPIIAEHHRHLVNTRIEFLPSVAFTCKRWEN